LIKGEKKPFFIKSLKAACSHWRASKKDGGETATFFAQAYHWKPSSGEAPLLSEIN